MAVRERVSMVVARVVQVKFDFEEGEGPVKQMEAVVVQERVGYTTKVGGVVGVRGGGGGVGRWGQRVEEGEEVAVAVGRGGVGHGIMVYDDGG